MTHPVTGAGPSRRRLAVLTVAMLAALAVLLTLGTWQVRRLAWKEALIERVESRLGADPVPVPERADWPSLKPEAIEFLPVRLDGVFDHGREIHVFIALANPNGPVGGQGYFVMTPLSQPDGTAVFVNRGFVPLDRKDPATRIEGQVAGTQTVTGLLRPAEQPTWVSPDPNVEKNVWFVRDPAAMAEAAGLDPQLVAPFTVDSVRLELPGGLPQGGETVVRFTNNHLGYAITWYGLAAALVAVWGTLVWRRPGSGRDRTAP